MHASRIIAVAGVLASLSMSAFAQTTQPGSTNQPGSSQSGSGTQPGSGSQPGTPGSSWDRSGTGAQQWQRQRGTLSETDERGLRERVNSFVAALNQHDVSTIATFMAPDVDIVTPTGKVIQGRDSIETMMGKKTDKASTCRADLTVSNIRGFGEIALVDLDGTVTGPTMGTWWHDESMGYGDGQNKGQGRSQGQGRSPDADRSGSPSTSSPNSQPGSSSPGTSTPGSSTPGSTTPGSSTPGSSSSGNSTDSSTSGSQPGTGSTRSGSGTTGTPGMGRDGTSGHSAMAGEGRAMPTHITLVMRKQGGEWMIEAGRPTLVMGRGGMGGDRDWGRDANDRNRSTTPSGTPSAPRSTPGSSSTPGNP